MRKAVSIMLNGVVAVIIAFAIVIALVSFLGTIAYATYVERGDPQ